MTTKIKSGVISDNAITSAHISSGAISSAHLTGIDTDAVSEGSSNLYFTTARVDSHLSGGTGVTYSSGAISIGQSVATSASPTFANLTLTGNLNITGDVDSVSVTDLDVTDKTITVGVGGTASANDGAGIVVDGASASILWNNSNTSWDFNNPIESSRVNTNTVNNVGNSANIIYRSSTNTIVGNNASALVVQDAGNVGIGTTSPSTDLHVVKTSTTLPTIAGDTVGILESNGTAALSVISGTGNSVIRFGDSADENIGQIRYVHASDKLDFTTNTNIAMTIDTSGNVGIGTSSPSAKLHVEVADNTEFLKATITGNESWAFKGASGSGATDYVSFGLSSGTQCMTWQEDGNVGIGTTSPGNTLDVQNSGDNIIQTTGVISGGVTALKLRQSRGSLSSPTNSSTNGDGNYIVSQIYRDAGYNSNAWIGLVTDANADDGRIVFGTASSGTVAERMRIDASGNVGIGCSPSYPLEVQSGGVGTVLRAGTSFVSIDSTGSESAPSLIFNGDANTGIWRPASDTLAVSTAGSESMRIDSSGQVGIGTTNPSEMLHMNNTAGTGCFIRFQNTGGSGVYIGGRSEVMEMYTNGSEKMRITSDGNVGIGTNNPSGAKLHVAGAIKGTDLIAHDSNGLAFQTDEGTKRISILDSGNVVIGDNSLIGSKPTGSALNIFGDGVTLRFDGGSNSTKTILFRGTSAGNPGEVYADGGLRFRTEDANMPIYFHTNSTGSNNERMRIDYYGVRLEDGAMAYEQNRPLFSGANASSYSTSTNLAYTKATDQYSVTGEAFKARVRARAYTKYVHMKTNLSSDNIMFFFRIYGYFYNYGVNESVRGGYTYNTNQVITESVANAYNANSNYTIGDFYRSSSGNFLCVRLDVHQTGYTEGEALVFFGSHSNTVTRELEITDMQHRDDGNNAY